MKIYLSEIHLRRAVLCRGNAHDFVWMLPASSVFPGEWRDSTFKQFMNASFEVLSFLPIINIIEHYDFYSRTSVVKWVTILISRSRDSSVL
jgi:hypothetical protein